MPIDIRESFQVRAPIDVVWRFLLDPHQVVACMPGAELEEIAGEDTFLGNIRVKAGPITTTYKGRAQFTEVDPQAYTIRMTAEGLEASGGSARGTMFSRLQPSADGGTEVTAEASAELTGRVMQFGRGMVQGVSQQLFQQFADAVVQRLESPEEERAAAPERQPIAIVPLVLREIWTAIVRLFRRLFRRPAKPQ